MGVNQGRMALKMRSVIEEIAANILEQNPGLLVRYRLLRDVLKRDSCDLELHQARQEIDQARQIRDLAAE